MTKYKVVHDDILKWAKDYDGPPFMALLCDPPHHLYNDKRGITRYNGGMQDWKTPGKLRGFMGKAWDGGDIAFRSETWAALAEHLLPGAFGMAFASARGWHRLACAIEDAGLRIHPSIFLWAFGSGFPKATRIDTQIDKVAGGTAARYKDAQEVGGKRGRAPKCQRDSILSRWIYG